MSSNNIQKSVISYNDTVSSLNFCKTNQNLLISSSWDGTITILEDPNYSLAKGSFSFQDEETKMPLPILYADFIQNSESQIISLDIENTLRLSNISQNKSSSLSLPINSQIFNISQVYNSPSNFILFDREQNIYNYDIRTKNNCNVQTKTERQITSAKTFNNMIITGDIQQITFYDNRAMDKSILTINHHLNGSEITSLEYIENESVILGGAEGKIAVEYLDSSKGKSYSFKCHRIEESESIKLYAVNSIIYDNKRKIYFSGGSDGYIYGWDYIKRKKVFKSEKEKNAIVGLDIKKDKTKLAYAVSYLYEDGNFEEESNKSKDNNFINIINEVEFFISQKK